MERIDGHGRYYEHIKRRELFQVVTDRDLYGRVVIRDLRGREFAVDQGVLDNLYTPVEESEAGPIFACAEPSPIDARPPRLRETEKPAADNDPLPGGFSVPWGGAGPLSKTKGKVTRTGKKSLEGQQIAI